MSDRELLERVVKIEEELVRVVKRLDTSFDRRMEPIRIQMDYHKMILFKVVVPIAVGLAIYVMASSAPGTTAINGAGNVIKSFIGQ